MTDIDRSTVMALSEHLDREPDEPWMPEGLSFKAGDRVQVKISLECEYCLDPRFPTCYANALADDGRTATVYDVGHDWCSCRFDEEPPGIAHLGHTVWVTWDDRRDYDDPKIEGIDFDTRFAPSELIPLDTEGDGRCGEDGR